MASRSVWARHKGLLALNAGLLVALGGVVAAPMAFGQRAATRQRGDYTMVAGQILGSQDFGLYVLDAANQEMVCLQFDRTRQSMKFIGYRDLAADARAASTRSR